MVMRGWDGVSTEQNDVNSYTDVYKEAGEQENAIVAYHCIRTSFWRLQSTTYK